MGFANLDINNEVVARQGLGAGAYTTAQSGDAIDTFVSEWGKQAKMALIVVNCGTVTDGTIDLNIIEDDAVGLGTASDVPAARIYGDESPSFTSANDEQTVVLAVDLRKRYLAVNTLETVASAGYDISISCVLFLY